MSSPNNVLPPSPHVRMDGDESEDDKESRRLAELAGGSPGLPDDNDRNRSQSVLEIIGESVVTGVTTTSEAVTSGVTTGVQHIGSGANVTGEVIGTGVNATGEAIASAASLFGGFFGFNGPTLISEEQATAEDESAWRECKGEDTSTGTDGERVSEIKGETTERLGHLPFGSWKTPEKEPAATPEKSLPSHSSIDESPSSSSTNTEKFKPADGAPSTAPNRRGSEAETWHDVQTPAIHHPLMREVDSPST